MSAPQLKAIKQKKIARLNIVSDLYKKGWSIRQIRAEVMARLDLPTLSTGTVKRDIDTLLEEWRDDRVKDTDALLELELARIDETCKELWEQWERSKEESEVKTTKRKGIPRQQGDGQQQPGGGQIHTLSLEEKKVSQQGLGDPRYIAEIRAQLMERRRLLGLYAPEKQEISGEMSFAAFLQQSGVVDDAEEDIKRAGGSV
jgi:hypothetical protein